MSYKFNLLTQSLKEKLTLYGNSYKLFAILLLLFYYAVLYIIILNFFTPPQDYETITAVISLENYQWKTPGYPANFSCTRYDKKKNALVFILRMKVDKPDYINTEYMNIAESNHYESYFKSFHSFFF